MSACRNRQPNAIHDDRATGFRDLLIKSADQAGLGERQVAEFIEHQKIQQYRKVGEPSLAAGPGPGFQLVDQIDGKEPAARTPRMQERAMAIARWLLPVPVPPTSTALR
jgi:hypothetical protein